MISIYIYIYINARVNLHPKKKLNFDRSSIFQFVETRWNEGNLEPKLPLTFYQAKLTEIQRTALYLQIIDTSDAKY